MILKEFYNKQLAQASYMVGCAGSKEAIVIDPTRDAQMYVNAAKAEGLNIVAVTETHIHADFASGIRELAVATGATMYLSDEGDKDWKYAFGNEGKLVKSGDSLRIGGIRFDVIKTPGHTPEHITFIVTDEPASSAPWGAFTGDFVFVGDVGRPDLLENAAGIKGTMEAGANDLFRSIQSFKALPDHLLIWPGHGAGSACGKSLGSVPVTALGFEKLSNWAFKAATESSFRDEVLAGQPDPPLYFAEMKRLNKVGAKILGGLPAPLLLDALPEGAMLVDIRSSAENAQAHVAGALHLPFNAGFTNWAGWLLPYRQDLYLLADSQEQANSAASALVMIGLDDVKGWVGLGSSETKSVLVVGAGEAAELHTGSKMTILDIRSKSEYESGHIPGAIHIPLGRLPSRLGELPRGGPIAVHCQGGVRSPIGVSVLENAGFEVLDVNGGFLSYANLGLPVETGPGVSPAQV